MPAAKVRKPKVDDLKLTPIQLTKAKNFVEDLGIGVNDDLYYYAILWCKENQKSNGDYITTAQRKKFDEDVKKGRKSTLIQKILAEITLLETVKKDDRERRQANTAAAAERISKTRNKQPKTKPIIPPPKVSITVDKVEVEKGESYTVSWKSENALVVSRSYGFFPKIADGNLSGSKTIVANRIGSKSYGITVRNSTGRAASATTRIQVVDLKTIEGQEEKSPTIEQSQTVSKKTRISRQSTAPNQVLTDIHDALSSIVKLLKNQNNLVASSDKIRRREAETERRKKRESILERSKGIGQKLLNKPITKIQNIFESVLKFIFLTLLGRIFTEFIKWASDPKNEGKVKSITRFLKDFWMWIGGAAALFFTPLGGFIKGLIKTLIRFNKLLLKLPIRGLLTSPVFLGIAAIAGAAVAANEVTGQRKAAKLQTERAAKVKSGQAIDVPGVDIINEKYKTPGISGRTQPGLLQGASTGGIVTAETGVSVKGAGVDTQLVPISGGGSVVLQKGETVLQKGAREKMISSTGIDPLIFNTGANANKPRTIGNKLTAMSTGGVVGAKYNTELVKPQSRYILQRLIQGGLTPNAAAGIVANIGVETGYTYDPSTLQLEGGPGRGLVQWEKGGRFDTDNINLQSFAKRKNKPWTDLNTQIDFILHEMKVHPEYQQVKIKINKAKSIEEATNIFLRDYEKAGTPHVENRLAVGKELVKTGWLNPPKQKVSNKKTPNLLESIFGIFGASANEKPNQVQKTRSASTPSHIPNSAPRTNSAAKPTKPTRPTTNKKASPKPIAPQRAWWDPRRLVGMKKGGLVDANLPVAGTASDDRHLALLAAGEYIIPRVTVRTMGAKFFDEIVANTDENSNAAKIVPAPRMETPITPLGSGGVSAFITLPPIMKNAMKDSTDSATTSVPSFGAVSPMANNSRAMLAEIYGIG